MTEKPNIQKPMRLNSHLKFRMKVMIAGILGGGTMIAFPTASAAVVIYVALALGTIGMMAWTGVMALALVAAAALIVPALIVITVLLAVAGVRCLMRMASPRGDVMMMNFVTAGNTMYINAPTMAQASVPRATRGYRLK